MIGLRMDPERLRDDNQGDHSFDYSPDREEENRPTKNNTKTFSSVKKAEAQRSKTKKPKDPSSSDLNNLVPTEIQVNTEAAESLFSSFE